MANGIFKKEIAIKITDTEIAQKQIEQIYQGKKSKFTEELQSIEKRLPKLKEIKSKLEQMYKMDEEGKSTVDILNYQKKHANELGDLKVSEERREELIKRILTPTYLETIKLKHIKDLKELMNSSEYKKLDDKGKQYRINKYIKELEHDDMWK